MIAVPLEHDARGDLNPEAIPGHVRFIEKVLDGDFGALRSRDTLSLRSAMTIDQLARAACSRVKPKRIENSGRSSCRTHAIAPKTCVLKTRCAREKRRRCDVLQSNDVEIESGYVEHDDEPNWQRLHRKLKGFAKRQAAQEAELAQSPRVASQARIADRGRGSRQARVRVG
jgi:hypothetical protein